MFSPEGPNKAIIGLSAAAVQAEFLLGEGTTTLIKFAAGNKPPVRGILDKPMVLKDLVQEMRGQGVDIFPDYDSHCYIEGNLVGTARAFVLILIKVIKNIFLIKMLNYNIS